MAVHPLRPATHHRLGEPLPHQLTNGTQSSLTAHIAFITKSCDSVIISGISIRFQMLSQSVRQVLYALLTRPPPSPEGSSRLACVKHSVSVHPEPGSNSSFNLFTQFFQLIVYTYLLFVDFFISLYSVANVLKKLKYQSQLFVLTLFILTHLKNYVNYFFCNFSFLKKI